MICQYSNLINIQSLSKDCLTSNSFMTMIIWNIWVYSVTKCDPQYDSHWGSSSAEISNISVIYKHLHLFILIKMIWMVDVFDDWILTNWCKLDVPFFHLQPLIVLSYSMWHDLHCESNLGSTVKISHQIHLPSISFL